jgi:Asp-tRNA(Asn)/Glu-tRNA(Gln) amidotransferase A subunit family amidase
VGYDLVPVKAPRLAGAALRLLARLLEIRFFLRLLAPKLMADMGITRFRNRRSEAPPTFLPWSEPTDEARAGAALPLSELPRPVRLGRGGSARSTTDDYRRAYEEGRSSPEAVAEAVLRSIRESNDRDPPLRAIIRCDDEDVRRQARASAERWRRGAPLSWLDGVPVAVKDELDQVPYPTAAGTRIFGTRPARADATPVARLRAAGALLVGKANMHEIGLGVTGMNPHTGFCRNPWDPERATGGSSSGPAAAVGSGLVPIALGADGGGSIRIPAALCGVVGLKPTFGRVSEKGAFPICWSVAHVGPLAASAQDCALAYAVCAGPDPADPVSAVGPPVQVQPLTGQIGGLRLGVYRSWFQDADPEVVKACEAMLAHLEKQGAELREIEIPDLEPLRVAHAITIVTEMASALEGVYTSGRQEELSAETRINIALARTLTGRDYMQAQRARTETIAHFRRVLDLVDLVVTPATARAAPPIRREALAHGESDLVTLSELMRFIVAPNFAGLPAISFPAGFTAGGLPVGMQAIGRWWDEHRLLQLAQAAEPAVEARTPAVFYRPLPA